MLSDRPPLTHYLFVWEIRESGRRRRRRIVQVVEGRTPDEADQALLEFMERPNVRLLESGPR